jgi:hypothetical protein
MMDRLDEVPESRFRALREIEKEKLHMTRTYSKKVKEKSFVTWYGKQFCLWQIRIIGSVNVTEIEG